MSVDYIAFFEVLYDVTWIVGVYGALYKGLHLLLGTYSNVLKALFNIDVKYYIYTKETATYEQHRILYTGASFISFFILTINPIIHSIMYILLFNMVDVVQFNNILLTVLVLRGMFFIDFMSKHVTLVPQHNIQHAFLVFQILYVILNYSNVTTAIPVLFQIIDEAGAYEDILRTTIAMHGQVTGVETPIGKTLMYAMITLQKWRTRIRTTHLLLLISILVTSFLYADMKYYGEVIFYYYALVRIVQLVGEYNI